MKLEIHFPDMAIDPEFVRQYTKDHALAVGCV
jgi:hypothetical protein